MKFMPWRSGENSSSSPDSGNRAVLLRRSIEPVHNIFRKQRNRIKGNAESVCDRIHDCRRWAVHREFTDALRAVRSVHVSQLFKEHANVRQVARGGHDVIGHLAILHASILPNYFFVKAESNPLGNSTDDLSPR